MKKVFEVLYQPARKPYLEECWFIIAEGKQLGYPIQSAEIANEICKWSNAVAKQMKDE